jgi:hypothetical protein
MPRHALCAASLALLAAGCTGYQDRYPIGEPSHELLRRTLPGAGLEVFRLETRVATGDAWLEITRERDRQRPFLGLKLAELDTASAARRGLEPWTGMLVLGTYPDSAAAQGGVLAGDVLRSIDGRATITLNQVAEAEANLSPAQPATVHVWRDRADLALALSAHLLKERVTSSDSVPLDAPVASQRPFAGFTLRGLAPVWCEQIFGSPRPVTVITTVDVGSPAWLAGFRGGDLVEAVDGGPPPPAGELARTIDERGARGQPITLRVRQGTAVHEASIALHDFAGATQVGVPLVFDVADGVAEDRWSLLPFGLLAAHSFRYLPDADREARTESTFSCLFGLVQVQSRSDGGHVRLFWLITL